MDGVRTRPPCVLLLEREEALRQVLTEALSGLGYETLASGGRKQALAFLLEHSGVDLVPVDLVDTAADGEAAVAFLGDQPETVSIPLIVMTDGEHENAPSRAVQLAKPFGLEELASAVRSATARAKHSSGRGDANAQHDAR